MANNNINKKVTKSYNNNNSTAVCQTCQTEKKLMAKVRKEKPSGLII